MAKSSEVVDRRGAILAAAQKVFDARGYAETTMEEVAEAAGISKGSIYNYFQSKHDLFGQLFQASLAGHRADMEKIVAEPGSASQKLQMLLDQWFGRLWYYKRMGRLILEFWAAAAREAQEGELAATFREMYGTARSRVAAIIANGSEAGEFASDFDPMVAASLIMSVVDGINLQAILDVGVQVNEEFIALLKRAIMTALTVPSTGGQPAPTQGGGDERAG